jgi:recombination protein RecR
VHQANIRKFVHECTDCFRIFKNTNTEEKLCERCRSGVLDKNILAVVEKNIDAENFIEKTRFPGLVFVLGGVFPVIEKKVKYKVRLEELINLVKKQNFQEVIICTSLTNDGLFTGSVIKQKIKELGRENLKVTTLGRGFSTGTELEYADKDTLLNALNNRSENLI